MATFKLTPDNEPNQPENGPTTKPVIGDTTLIAQAIAGSAEKVCSYFRGSPQMPCKRCGKTFAEHYPARRR